MPAVHVRHLRTAGYGSMAEHHGRVACCTDPASARSNIARVMSRTKGCLYAAHVRQYGIPVAGYGYGSEGRGPGRQAPCD